MDKIAKDFLLREDLERHIESMSNVVNGIDSPSFTQKHQVKLVNLGETRQVSHGGTINQAVMSRWNL